MDSFMSAFSTMAESARVLVEPLTNLDALKEEEVAAESSAAGGAGGAADSATRDGALSGAPVSTRAANAQPAALAPPAATTTASESKGAGAGSGQKAQKPTRTGSAAPSSDSTGTKPSSSGGFVSTALSMVTGAGTKRAADSAAKASAGGPTAAGAGASKETDGFVVRSWSEVMAPGLLAGVGGLEADASTPPVAPPRLPPLPRPSGTARRLFRCEACGWCVQRIYSMSATQRASLVGGLALVLLVLWVLSWEETAAQLQPSS